MSDGATFTPTTRRPRGATISAALARENAERILFQARGAVAIDEREEGRPAGGAP
ncbi:hypothetical protein AB5J52_40835 [Streptomyces sp. R39]|uniref:Uncharacterized protein n=1 Tax=Streptomyces sp. R39 TaxID=3238631 RepID=A0AB39QWR4_9ACTN